VDVLFDMTPLLIDSRFRGIGHYVVSLARAIDRLSDGEREGLEVRALVDLDGEVGALGWRGYEDVTTMRLVPWLMRRRTRSVPECRIECAPELSHTNGATPGSRKPAGPRLGARSRSSE